ncbi:hypothetical protein E2C01_058222 [Portunus trituberculatus]|uniref:Uncharacterized protein n=1 Tax=Portunus trituberculatus TaxID=210409 RepID=A0A5B7GV09_PORTR|nr:hypothetical protein [Portunus trituberculatus]
MPFRSLDLRQATSGAAWQPSLPRLPSRPSLTLPVPHYLALFHIIARKWRFLPSPHFPRQPHTSLALLTTPALCLTLTTHRASFSPPILRLYKLLLLVDAISSSFLPPISSILSSLSVLPLTCQPQNTS